MERLPPEVPGEGLGPGMRSDPCEDLEPTCERCGELESDCNCDGCFEEEPSEEDIQEIANLTFQAGLDFLEDLRKSEEPTNERTERTADQN